MITFETLPIFKSKVVPVDKVILTGTISSITSPQSLSFVFGFKKHFPGLQAKLLMMRVKRCLQKPAHKTNKLWFAATQSEVIHLILA